MPRPTGIPGLTEAQKRAKEKRADARLHRKAVLQRWPIPAEVRPKLVKNMVEVALDKKDRLAGLRATNTLVLMDGQNQEDDQLREKNVRLDMGKATERVEVEQIIVEKPVRRK